MGTLHAGSGYASSNIDDREVQARRTSMKREMDLIQEVPEWTEILEHRAVPAEPAIEGYTHLLKSSIIFAFASKHCSSTVRFAILVQLKFGISVGRAITSSTICGTPLNFLDLSGTGVCAPMDDSFQAWLENIATRLGVVNCREQSTGDPLIDRYDANNNGTIEKGEVIATINDYLFGEGDEAISKAEVIRLINVYLFG